MLYMQRYAYFKKYKRKAAFLGGSCLFVLLLLINHFESAIRNECFGNSDAFRCLVVFEQCSYDTGSAKAEPFSVWQSSVFFSPVR